MSGNVVQGPEHWKGNIVRSLSPEPRIDLASDGGPPHDPIMEARVTNLERDVGDIKSVFSRLEPILSRIDDRLGRVEDRLDHMDGRLDRIDGRLDHIDGRLALMDDRFGRVEGRLDRMEGRFDYIDERFRKIEMETLPKLGADIAELRGRVSQLPTAIQLVGFILAVLVIAGLTKVFSP